MKSVRFLTPDIAVGECAYDIAHEKDSTGQDVTETGLYTTVRVRKDGKWWIVSSRPMHPAAP